MPLPWSEPHLPDTAFFEQHNPMAKWILRTKRLIDFFCVIFLILFIAEKSIDLTDAIQFLTFEGE